MVSIQKIIDVYNKEGNSISLEKPKSEYTQKDIRTAKRLTREILDAADPDTVFNIFLLAHSALIAELEEDEFKGSGGYEL